MSLSNAEELIMEIIWKQGPLFLKDLVHHLPDPKPATTTVATLLARMQKKKFVGYKSYGNSREYYALVPKESYSYNAVNSLVDRLFEKSNLQLASFFTSSGQLSVKELETVRKMIDEEIEKRKKK